MNKFNKGVLIITLLATASGVNAQDFRQGDAAGIGMTIIAMVAIFFGLILLYLAFRIIANIAINLSKKNSMKAQGITDKTIAQGKAIGPESGDVLAAIAMALHEYQDNVHDVEDTVLTINKVKRNYSPWSSKIYTLTETPRRR